MNGIITLAKINTDITGEWNDIFALDADLSVMTIFPNENSKIFNLPLDHPISIIYSDENKIKFYSTRILRFDPKELKVILKIDSKESFSERRKHIRYMVNFIGRVINKENESIKIINTSLRGIRIKSQNEYNYKDQIEITTKINEVKINFSGIIMTKLKTSSGYEYGIKLIKVSKWS